MFSEIQYATMSTDSALLLNFQHKINEAVSLVQTMSTEQKLKAVQLWNFVSESLQDMVNSSANDIYALATQRCLRESHGQDEHPRKEEDEQHVFSGLGAHVPITKCPANSGVDGLVDDSLAVGCVTDDCTVTSGQHLLTDQSLLLFPSAANDTPLTLSPPDTTLTLPPAQPSLIQSTDVGSGDFSRLQHPHAYHLQPPQLVVASSPSTFCPAPVTAVVSDSGPAAGGEDELVELLSSASADPAALLDAALAQQPLQHQERQPVEGSTDGAIASSGWRHSDGCAGDGESSDAVAHDDGDDSLLIVEMCGERCTPSSLHNDTAAAAVVGNQTSLVSLPPMPSLLDPTSSRRVSQPQLASSSVGLDRPQPIDNFTCHRHLESGLTDYRCNVCSHTFTSLRAFYTHYRAHTRRFVCAECGVSFAGNSQLVAHLSTHSMAVSSTAVSSPVHTSTRPAASCYTTVTSSLAPALAPAAALTPATAAGLDVDSSSVSVPNTAAVVDTVTTPAMHACSVCRREFRARSNLVRHMRRHTGEKPFVCEVCSRRFTEKKSLQVHWRVHTGERPFACTLCSARFRQQGNLDSHMESHVGLRPHLCDLCGKRFRQRSQLRLHTQRHEDKKQFKCDQCSLAFNVVNDLMRHKRCHLETKPYPCDLCEKTFCRPEALSEHLNRHFDRRPFSCPHCERSFPELSACRRHIRTHGSFVNSSTAAAPPATVILSSYTTTPPAVDCAQITA